MKPRKPRDLSIGGRRIASLVPSDTSKNPNYIVMTSFVAIHHKDLCKLMAWIPKAQAWIESRSDK